MLFEFPARWFRRLAGQERPKSFSASQSPHEISKLISTISGSASRKAFTADMQSFITLYSRYSKETENDRSIKWDNVRPPAAEFITSYDALPPCADMTAALNRLAVLKLDGLYNQSMGSSEATSLLEVKNGMTCLDLTAQQIGNLNSTYHTDIPLILLSSFLTHGNISAAASKHANHQVKITALQQSRYPRIPGDLCSATLKSIKTEAKAWYPPGHGDVYESLYRSGLLDRMLSDGKEYLFLSNSSNLSATVDERILQYMIDTKTEFIMEVTSTKDVDVEGGIVVEYGDKPRLLERAQVPYDQLEHFKSLRKFGTFNTNNLWIHLPALKRMMDANRLKLDIIRKAQAADDTQPTIQLGTAAGAAISHFQNIRLVKVPESRFLPLKRSSDLLIVRSNLYHAQRGRLVMNEQRMFHPPTVKLSDHFKTAERLERRFASVPELLELDQLTISGDVYLGRNIKLKGTIIIIADEGQRLDIPDNSDLENRLISGNMTVTEL